MDGTGNDEQVDFFKVRRFRLRPDANPGRV